MYFTQSLHKRRVRYKMNSIAKFNGLEIFDLGCHTELKDHSLSNYFLIEKGKLFDSCLSWRDERWVKCIEPPPGFETRVPWFISHEDNLNPTNVWKMMVRHSVDGATIAALLAPYSKCWRYFCCNLKCLPIVRKNGVQSLVESYQILKKWYLMPPCLILRYGSRVKRIYPEKAVVPSPSLRCGN